MKRRGGEKEERKKKTCRGEIKETKKERRGEKVKKTHSMKNEALKCKLSAHTCTVSLYIPFQISRQVGKSWLAGQRFHSEVIIYSSRVC